MNENDPRNNQSEESPPGLASVLLATPKQVAELLQVSTRTL